MNYKEACELSRGQEYAKPTPLKTLPFPRPIPDQETQVRCSAPVQPNINRTHRKHPDRNHVEVNLFYGSRGEAECIKNPPECGNCRISKIANQLEHRLVTLRNEDYESNNLEAFIPQL